MEKKKNKSLLVLIVLGIIALIVIIALMVIRNSGGKKAIRKFCKGLEKSDAEAVIKLMIPEDYYDTFVKENKEYIKEAEQTESKKWKKLDKVSYEIKSKKKNKRKND